MMFAGLEVGLGANVLKPASKQRQKVMPQWRSDEGYEAGLGANVLKDRDKTASKSCAELAF